MGLNVFMIIVYIVISLFVTALLLAVLLFPFWKVWARIKTHHPDIWRSAGPFEPEQMLASPGLAGIFTDVVVRMNRDKALQAADPYLAKWVRVCIEEMRLLPRTTPSRIFCLALLIWLVFSLTKFLIAH
jgi:hypothetical protein